MFNIGIELLLFLLGFALLIKGGDWFVDGSVGIAHRFHLPELLIGATVVSIGTTLPEVMVSSQAALQNSAGISYGNAIGSIICNTSLIAGLTIAIKPGVVNRKSLYIPTIAFFVSAIFYSLIAYTKQEFYRWHGIILLIMFITYMFLSVRQMASNSKEVSEENNEESIGENTLLKDILMLVVGAIAIAIGSNLLVNNGIIIASLLGVPDSVIGLTMIALGTSLPELVTAITSLIKGHGSLSLGNIIGANLFNIVFVSGLAISISPFKIPSEKTLMGLNSSLLIDIPLMLIVMLILCIPALKKEKLFKWQGILLLVIYTIFTIYQFVI